MASSPEEVYAALPLQDEGDIRVIEIQPGENSDVISVSMRCVSLFDPELSYDGLSYTWGDQAALQNIICNQVPLLVTQNLYSALQRLREMGRRTLWADALCIDQGNSSERASQVKQMKTIYSHAKSVWVDLGPGLPNMENLFSLIKKVGAALFMGENENDFSPIESHRLEEYGIPAYDDDAWILWMELMARPYLHRTWVIQEFTVAQEVKVLIGTRTLPWDVLYYYTDRMSCRGIGEDSRRRHPKTTLKTKVDAIQGRNGVNALTHCRDAYQHHGSLDIHDLFVIGRSMLASDPKDKVFGVLGMAKGVDLSQPDFQVIYDEDESVAQLFTRISCGMIRERRGYALGCMLEGGTQVGERLKGLPSWVPDWTKARAGKPLGGLPHPPYHAADKLDLVADLEDLALRVRGRIIDRVGAMTSLCFPDGENERSESYFSIYMSKMFQETLDLVESTWPGVLNEDDEEFLQRREALWRTLICNKTTLHEPAPITYREHFESNLKYQRVLITAIREQQAVEDVNFVADEEFFLNGYHSMIYRLAMQDTMFTKRFGITAGKKLMGRLPGETREGDYVVLVAGSPVPFIMRAVDETREKWILIQECYVHGVMNGEYAGDDVSGGDWQDISIV